MPAGPTVPPPFVDPAKLAALQPGTNVWAVDEEVLYRQAVVEQVNADGATATLQGRSASVPIGDLSLLDPADAKESDLVQMANIDTPNILHTLRTRHTEGSPYTNVGLKGILVSVNPYRWIDGLYETSLMHEHHTAFESQDKLPPHVFALASDAYKALCTSGTSQTLVTSGESGSGKTENSKQVFRFLAEIAGAQGPTDGAGPGDVSLQELLVNANPVLEAFGNAKTLRNDNSSRFGKLVTVHFDGSGKIIGAYNRNYLLERTRCATPPEGERNYHSFYQLLAGSTDAVRARCGLASEQPVHYAMLNKSTCTTVPSIDDAAEYRDTFGAARALGFSDEETDAMVDVLGALLHLGNTQFEAEATGHGDDAAKLVHTACVDYAAYLLAADRMAVTGGMTLIRVKTQRDDTSTRMSVPQAEKNRDAFISGIYANLFDWIVNRINAVGRHEADSGGAKAMGKFIGVLDIFGFEIFQTNSFEQLCINFANEKLQRNFTMTTFQAEEGLYTAEGIEFDPIEYIDNQPILNLLDLTPGAKEVAGAGANVTKDLKGLAAQAATRGIIQMIDEEVRLPKVSDRGTLLVKMNAAFGGDERGRGGHPYYATDYRTRESKESIFTIKHYAGDVKYCIDGFLEKSMENISAELVAACKASSKPLVAQLFTQRSSRDGGGAGGGGAGGGGSRKASVGLSFSKQLASLIATIEETQAHFIRCIKPNAQKSASVFDAKLTLEQLNYSGVFEAVTIRKCGYPFRLTHKEFCLRFRLLIPLKESKGLAFNFRDAKATQADAAKMVEMLPGLSEPYAAAQRERGADLAANSRIGHTRVFYRSAEARALEMAREAVIIPLICRSQRAARGAISRGARRELAAAKATLAAAVEAKQLEQLESALENCKIPHRTFYHGASIYFTLYIHNMAAIAALHNDLRDEPVVDRALGLACSEQDLGAQYEHLCAYLERAEGLNERLGRPVPWMQYAEAIVGLTQGVEDHDHERLVACLAASERLGLAPRLTKQSEIARAEVKMLEEGMVLERAITAELAVGRSKYIGEAKWDHKPMTEAAMAKLRAALEVGVNFPLVSKSGLRLIAQANAALTLRAQLLADDWSGLVQTLEGLQSAAEAMAGKKGLTKQQKKQHEQQEAVAKYDEVVGAWSELKDVCSVREDTLAKELKAGRSKRLGVGNEFKWSHKAIETGPLVAAQKAVTDFAYVTEKGRGLLDEAALSLSLRTALLRCEWGKASTWAPLADVLDAEATLALRNAEEVVLAWQEFGDMRAATEATVQVALDTGRSVKRTGAAAAVRSGERMLGGNQSLWNHEGIDSTKLQDALGELEAFPRVSDHGKALAARAVRAVMLRGALLQAQLAEPSSWGPVAEVLDAAADRSASAYDASAARGDDEIAAGREELDDARTYYEAKIKEEMGRGRSVQTGGGAPVPPKLAGGASVAPSWAQASKPWNRKDLSAEKLQAAVEACEGFPRPSSATSSLIEIGKVLIELRTTLLQTSWADAASWAPLADFFDDGELDVSRGDVDEVKDAQLEMQQAQQTYEAAVSAALGEGASAKTPSGWSHEAIAVGALTTALTQLRAFPRQSDRGRALDTQATLILALRTALQQASWTTAPSWSPLLAVLDDVEPGEMREMAEVKAAWKELFEYRDSLEAALKAALGQGRSVKRAGGGGEGTDTWSHEALSTEMVAAPLEQLRSFPRPSDAAASLGALADATLALRELLGGCVWEARLASDAAAQAAWTKLAEWLHAAKSGSYANGEEVLAAAAELADKRAAVAKEVKTALSSGRATRPVGGASKWSHDKVETSALEAALTELRALPAPLGVSEGLLDKQAALAITLRLAVQAASWDAASSWVALSDALASAPAQHPEEGGVDLADAKAEHEAARAYFEGLVLAELGRNRSVRKVKLGNSDEGWNHDSIKIEPLAKAAEELSHFPRPSERAAALGDLARVSVLVREALLQCTWQRSSSWTPLVEALEQGASLPRPAELLQAGGPSDEFDDARAELDEMRVLTERKVKEALATGHAIKRGDMWNHKTIATSALEHALANLTEFPAMSDVGRQLAVEGKLVLGIRSALVKCEWKQAASWLPLIEALDAVPAEHTEHTEIVSANKELAEKRLETLQAVRGALQKGASVKTSSAVGGWSHASIEVAALRTATDECAAFPRPPAEATSLIASARLIIQLREALLQVQVQNATSWAPAAAVLGSLPTDDLALAEVKAALLEFRQAREAVVTSVLDCMRRGCSKPPAGAAKAMWDHSALDSESLVRAALQLEHFPRVGDGPRVSVGGRASVGGAVEGGREASGSNAMANASARRTSIVARRQSLVRLAEEAEGIVTSAKRLGRLRELLSANDWAEVDAFLKAIEGGGGQVISLHEIAADEARRAAQELQDVAAFLEQAVQRLLDSGRSKPLAANALVDKKGRWDHSGLQVEPLREAAATLEKHPLRGATAATLLARAEVVSQLRETLRSENWAALARLLKTFSSEQRQLDEVQSAAQEMEDMRAATEIELKEALQAGKSVKIIGAKTTLSTKEWYVAVTWDHSGLAEGIARLEASVDFLVSFPEQKAGMDKLLAQAAHALAVRKLVRDADWAGLRAQLEREDDGLNGQMDESVTGWQELLCEELRVATGSPPKPGVPGVAPDQKALGKHLAAANLRGLLPQEAPVFKALAVYIDPPEYLIDLDHPEGDVYPDDSGEVVLTVKVRGASTYRWLKNSVQLKEGADNGRIVGVEGASLTFKNIVGRDVDQKVWCEATNKWGTVKSRVVSLRLPDEKRTAKKQFDNDVQESYAAQEKKKAQMQRDLQKQAQVGSLKDMDRLVADKPLLKKGESINDGLRQISGGI